MVLAHRFDLLGSGPTDLGEQIDWQLDFKTGRSWPLRHISRTVVTYPDNSDIKVPWELSRFQHLPILAGAYKLTGERRYLDEIGAQISDWIDKNPVEFGANWACTMDVAIRAANWIATLVMVADDAAGEPWCDQALRSLLLHGRFIESHLELAEYRGNHYLSDIAGLLIVAALFSGSEEGRDWGRWATAELVSEMDHQVREDGCDHEGSIPYHRLVAELFICATQAADALKDGEIPNWYRERLDKMLAFTSDYTRPDGLAPQVGDADDGRFLPLDDYASVDVRDHRHLFRQAGREYSPATGSAAYPKGGYFIGRTGDLYVFIRCGDTGLGGLGGHSHNDQLSFELAVGDTPLIVDPGAYLYTADPQARNLFRSTSFHATVQLDQAEQNPYSPESLFMLRDATKSELLEWTADEAGFGFRGKHTGFPALKRSVTHQRTINAVPGRVTISDEISGAEGLYATLTFPLAPGTLTIDDQRATLERDGRKLVIEASGLELKAKDGWISPSFGVREPTQFLRASKRLDRNRAAMQVVLRVE